MTTFVLNLLNLLVIFIYLTIKLIKNLYTLITTLLLFLSLLLFPFSLHSLLIQIHKISEKLVYLWKDFLREPTIGFS